MNKHKFYGKCLQGNVLEAIKYLEHREKRTKEVNELIDKYTKRFITHEEEMVTLSDDPWIEAVLSAYRCYFREALVKKHNKKTEDKLVRTLMKIINTNVNRNIDAVERELEYEFRHKGYSFLGGVTTPLRGPFIWKNTDHKTYEVDIPNGMQEVNVYYLSGFIMNSWHKYATFDEKQVDGWVKSDGIYYILKENEEVDDTSIDFHIWFLKHEAQRLYDNKNNPKLNSFELEYRAKLVELIYHPDIKSYIDKLYHQAKDYANLPHPYSSYMILDKMCEKLEVADCFGWWEAVNEEKLNSLVRNLFEESIKTLAYK